ncbi:MAG: hypothetical protein AB8G11_21490 [Saprospiraceae bacterium]
MRSIILSLFIITTGCTRMPVLPSSSVWITYDLIIDIKTDEDAHPIESLAINELAKKELIGAKVVFNQNKLTLSYTNNGKEQIEVGYVIKVTEDYFILKADDAEQKISYQMSSDRQECDFTFSSGTILYTERQH